MPLAPAEAEIRIHRPRGYYPEFQGWRVPGDACFTALLIASSSFVLRGEDAVRGPGAKSMTSAVALSERKRVIRTLLSASYICLLRTPPISGRIEKDPPRVGSSKAAKTVGESNSGKQKKSIEESIPTKATVHRFPMMP